MGYMRNHGIAVSMSYGEIEEIRNKAVEIFGEDRITPIMGPFTNGVISFFVSPDGSKEWWPTSDENDEKRTRFIEFIESKQYEDHSNAVSYCEFFWDDDEGMSEVVRHN